MKQYTLIILIKLNACFPYNATVVDFLHIFVSTSTALLWPANKALA